MPQRQHEYLDVVKQLPKSAQFAGLLVVILGALLGVVAYSASSKADSELLLVIGVAATVLMLATILSAHSLLKAAVTPTPALVDPPGPGEQTEEKDGGSVTVDVFLSAPVLPVGHKKRDEIIATVKALESELARLRLKVYAPLLDDSFSTEIPDASLPALLRRVRRSRAFVLYLPLKFPANSLVEVGVALAHRKYCLAFVNDPESLPYSLRVTGSMPAVSFNVYRETEAESIMKILVAKQHELRGVPRPLTDVSDDP